MMGPAKSLLKLLTCMNHTTWATKYYTAQGRVWHERYYDDQLAATECMFFNRDLAAIDYTGLMALAMNGVRPDVFESQMGVLKNKPFNEVQCFMHFNGMKTQIERAALRKWGFAHLGDKYWDPTQNTKCPHGFCHKR
eukprot:TRINITY_DN26776_c0_g3_i1.p2 TRINITY_DN26776_c0_g3~~TRINITY_DN26776_c0_g3_i1.p2  ORF type:complete len:137 (+),score=21.41 TRINITY_DN26776_c0_g3_i1:309-719(+)